MEKSNKSMHTE